MVAIPAIDGLTQARRLDEVEDMARQYIAVTLDVAPGSFELRPVTVVIEGVGDLTLVRAAVAELRRAADDAERAAAAETARAAAELSARHVPMRDIAAVLGVSHQRVAQVLDSTRRAVAHS